MNNINQEINAYKVMGKNGFWAVIFSDDGSSAEELFKEENKDVEISFVNKLDPKGRILNIYTNKRTPITEMINRVRFFPRCVLESTDLAGSY